jgi:hypothetical protein
MTMRQAVGCARLKPRRHEMLAGTALRSRVGARADMWGMNIITGKSREEEEAEAAAAAQAAEADGGDAVDAAERKRPLGKMVELRYGSYQGLQLSAAEVRRIKAEECRALLARRKLVRTLRARQWRLLVACCALVRVGAHARIGSQRVHVPPSLALAARCTRTRAQKPGARLSITRS